MSQPSCHPCPSARPATPAWRRAAVLGLTAAALMGWLTGCATGPESAPQAADSAQERVQDLQLQIFLDSRGFGPGVVDGRAGEFTRKALSRYQQASGLPANVRPDTAGIRPYVTYTIRAEDVEALGSMAQEPAEIARQSRLPYESLAELLGERFHTSRAFLAELNPGLNINQAAPGTVIRVPNVQRPFRYQDFPSGYASRALPVESLHILVDTREKMLEVRSGGQLMAAFPITPGSAEHPAPVGEWKVARSVPWPWYRYDEGVLKRGERTDSFYNFPPGPNSPVGILWAGLNRPGVGIHGSPNPETTGRAGSHGCIRLANWDAAVFYTLVKPGARVTIQ